MTAVPYGIGHGTENDFVILPDAAIHLDLTPELVRGLCDRRAGIGGDGVLRVATAGALLNAGVIDTLPEGVEDSDWFMDYRNADGSIAEMCGNGVRVFAHWVRSRGLVTDDQFTIGTRAGARPVTVHSHTPTHASVTVDMGPARVLGVSTCQLDDGTTLTGLGVDMGNPHLACVIDPLTPQQLAELPVAADISIDTDFFPHGTNVEILTPATDGTLHMRVNERGAGETRSCGTGTVAAARAALAHNHTTDGTVTVEVPGGTLTVTIDGDTSTLTGPSRIVATGSVELDAVTRR